MNQPFPSIIHNFFSMKTIKNMIENKPINSTDEVTGFKEESNIKEFLSYGKSISTGSNMCNNYQVRIERASLTGLYKPIILCLFISFGGFILGWDIGTIGGISNMSAFQNNFGTFLDPQTGLYSFPGVLIGLVISIFNIGCAIGGLTLAKMGDLQGRKRGIFITLFVYCVGLCVQVINSHTWQQFFVGRIICGLAVGSIAVLVPMFISEVSPLQIRGSMVSLYQLMITFGILCGNIANLVCKTTISNPIDNVVWQIPISLGFMWAAFICIGLLFTPESSQYLLLKGNNILKARKSFAIMNGLSQDEDYVVQTIDNMASQIQSQVCSGGLKKNISRFEFITGKPLLGLRLLTGILVMAFQQLSGVNYFFYYGTTLFDSVGLNNSYVTTIILSGANFISTFAGIYLVEKLGRKSCLLLGSVGMFLSMTIYASIGTFSLGDNSNGTSGAFMILFTCIYIMFFASTFGPVSIVVISELFPPHTKAISMAICTSVNWIVNFFISLFTPSITSLIGFRFGYVFSACLFISIICFWVMVPETKGLKIEEVNKWYSNNSPRQLMKHNFQFQINQCVIF